MIVRAIVLLAERGLVSTDAIDAVVEGWAADVVLFDADTVAPGPIQTRDDLPGGAHRLFAAADGVEHVLVNGVEVVRAGQLTGALPGVALRSGRDTETVPLG